MPVKGMGVRCSVCKITIFKEDAVFLDDINTVTHQRCYSLDSNLTIKDLGSYEQITDINPVLR